jgi:hypothetical protein
MMTSNAFVGVVILLYMPFVAKQRVVCCWLKTELEMEGPTRVASKPFRMSADCIRAFLICYYAPLIRRAPVVTKAKSAQETEPKAKVFISYSRKDMAFADLLEGRLEFADSSR